VIRAALPRRYAPRPGARMTGRHGESSEERELRHDALADEGDAADDDDGEWDDPPGTE
jgi:hypothetical protein